MPGRKTLGVLLVLALIVIAVQAVLLATREGPTPETAPTSAMDLPETDPPQIASPILPPLVFPDLAGPDPALLEVLNEIPEDELLDLGRKRATKLADELVRMNEAFHRLVGGPLGLPRLADHPRYRDLVQTVLVFETQELLREHKDALDLELPTTIVSQYNPDDQWAVFSLEDTGPHGNPVSTRDVRRLVWVATHQLFHVFGKVLHEAQTGKTVEWEDKRLHSKNIWIRRGFADLLAGSCAVDGDPVDLAGVSPLLLTDWSATLKSFRPAFPLSELLMATDRVDLYQRCRLRAHRDVRTADRLVTEAIARAWAFCHYLWNHEEGKHRPLLLAALKAELSGSLTLAEWTRMWTEAGGEPDWDKVDRRLREYVAKL